MSRAQTRALQELRNASSEEFQLVTNGGQNAPNDGKGPGSKVAAKIGLNDLSGREIGTMAEKEAKKAKRDKLNRPRVSPSSRPEIVAMTMRRLGIPAWRTAAMLGIDHNTLKKVSENSKANARIAFLIADWRDFQGMAAMEEDPDQSILLSDYMDIMRRSGWKVTHLIDCPLSTERFRPHMVKRMQNNKTLGVVRRSLIIGRRD